ncbi:exodeoxyribonuclease VII large subunit [Vibrio splendidus]|nr:exodeoxyribonuclease VII large subunit [Vibrio splendidus]MCC4882875.1 exodeoxyribonuclease VII large subunit [Vibrio splendidus]
MKLDRNLKLEIPFTERDEAKKLGAKPYYKDGEFLCWFVPKDVDVTPFRKWWTPTFMWTNNISEGKPNSLSTFLGVVRNKVSEFFSEGVWITAEISNVTGSSHIYLELVDYDQNGVELAKSRGMIWGKNKVILSNFEVATGMKIGNGMKVLLRVLPEFTEKYGLSLTVLDINPSFTVGEMEAKLNAIRQSLRQEGVFLANKSLTAPTNFFRVAVLSPDQAAGLGDFQTQSALIEKFGLCEFDYYSAVFQGENALRTITQAVNSINKAHEVESYDAVCIIRGGGDKAGLYALNDHGIAKAMLGLKMPILCGIGHERDSTIVDEIAHTRCATPSMVVNLIRDTIIGKAENDDACIKRIVDTADRVIERAESDLENNVTRIVDLSSALIDKAEHHLELTFHKIGSLSGEMINKSEMQRKEQMMNIMMNNPIAIMQKGYSLVRQDGELVKDVSSLKHGSTEIRLANGVAKVTISAIEESSKIELPSAI